MEVRQAQRVDAGIPRHPIIVVIKPMIPMLQTLAYLAVPIHERMHIPYFISSESREGAFACLNSLVQMMKLRCTYTHGFCDLHQV